MSSSPRTSSATSSVTRLRCSPARSGCCRRRASARSDQGLYEPIHGSAPRLAGKGIANPYGTILSVAMLLRHSLHRDDLAVAIESAVDVCISRGRAHPRPRGDDRHRCRRRRRSRARRCASRARPSEPRHEHRDLRHDVARRCPGRRHQLLGVRQAAHRRSARHARRDRHRGRMAGREPHRHRVLLGDAARTRCATRHSPRSARRAVPGMRRRTTCSCARCSTRWRRSSRWSARRGTGRSSTCCARRRTRTSR